MEIDRREIGSNQPRVIRQCGNCQGFRKWKRHFEIGFPTNHSDEFSIFRASHNPVSHRGWVNSSNIHRFSLSLYPAFTNRVFCNRVSLARGLNETTKGLVHSSRNLSPIVCPIACLPTRHSIIFSIK